MTIRRFLTCLTGLLLATQPAGGRLPDHPAISQAAVPSWVDAASPELAVEPVESGVEVDYLLLDRQVRLPDGGPPAVYTDLAYRIVARSALESLSSFEISFDPTYTRVEVHHLQVYRDGSWHDRLDHSRASVLHIEQDLHRQVFDQRVTLVLILDDVRVGDVVSLGYSKVGDNPVFEGRYVESFDLGWSLPVRRARLRILAAPGRPIPLKVHGPAPQPSRTSRAGWLELLWDQRDVAAVEYQPAAPSTVVQYPFVQLSEFSTWRSVADWAEPLYRAGPPPTELTTAADEIRASARTPEQRIVAARDWVQNEVRYFAVVMGRHSHAPHGLDEILRRRYGDCKDKTVLLVELLRLLDLDASPAFVSSTNGRSVSGWLPTPTVFDHAIVTVREGGRVHWIDPTLTHQGGHLEDAGQLYVPAYEVGLEIRPDSRELSPIPENQTEPGLISVAYEYDLEPGRSSRVDITTVYERARAESFRKHLSGTSPDEILEGYVESYSTDWFALEPLGPLQIEDDVYQNHLTVTEKYALTYVPVGEDDRILFEALPTLIDGLLDVPEDEDRDLPLAVSHPVHRLETLVLRAADDTIEFSELSHEESTPWFELKVSSELMRHSIALTYELRTLTDTVEAEDLPEYAAAVERARNALGYIIEDETGKEYRALAIASLLSAALVFGAIAGPTLLYLRHRALI